MATTCNLDPVPGTPTLSLHWSHGGYSVYVVYIDHSTVNEQEE